MNIKYRLLCKRLIEERKRVGVIQYYNVLFIMELVSDKDIWSLKSYFGTGLFAIIIHPITFYCSPFLLDMSTLFYQLTKIIHMYMLTTSRFFCIVLLKGGKCLCYIACVFDKH